MKNTLTIVQGSICTCVDSVANGSNSIYIEVEVKEATNPTLKIMDSVTNLTPNATNTVEIPEEFFTSSATVTFQYSDEIYTGKIFTINFPATLEGNLSVNKISDYVFNAKYTKPNSGGDSYELPIMTRETLGGAKVGDNMAITADGHLYAEVAPTEGITNLEIDAICTLE